MSKSGSKYRNPYATDAKRRKAGPIGLDRRQREQELEEAELAEELRDATHSTVAPPMRVGKVEAVYDEDVVQFWRDTLGVWPSSPPSESDDAPTPPGPVPSCTSSEALGAHRALGNGLSHELGQA